MVLAAARGLVCFQACVATYTIPELQKCVFGGKMHTHYVMDHGGRYRLWEKGHPVSVEGGTEASIMQNATEFRHRELPATLYGTGAQRHL